MGPLTCACAIVPARMRPSDKKRFTICTFMIWKTCSLLARHRPSINFDPRNVGPAALSVAAPGHQVDKSDFINFAQIGIRDDASGCNSALWIELDPLDRRQREFALLPVRDGSVSEVAHKHCSIGKLHEWPNLVKARHLRDPLDPGQTTEVNQPVLVAKRQPAGTRAHACPGMSRIAFVGCSAGDKDFLSTWAIDLSFEVRVRDVIRAYFGFILTRFVFPFFFEEQRYSRLGCGLTAGSSGSSSALSRATATAATSSPRALRWSGLLREESSDQAHENRELQCRQEDSGPCHRRPQLGMAVRWS